MNWRASLDRLPTWPQLSKRGVTPDSSLCLLCRQVDESNDHLFTGCPRAMEVWSRVSNWCKINPIIAFQVHDLHSYHNFLVGDKRWKKIINAIFQVTIWCLWKKRNEVVHENAIVSSTALYEEIKAVSFLWISNRAHKVVNDCHKWCNFTSLL